MNTLFAVAGQNYCFGTMMHKELVIPAQAGIQYRRAIADWTPAFAGVTNSDRIQTFPCRINGAFCRFRHMLPGTALSASRHWAPGGGVGVASNSNPFNWLGKGGVAGAGIALAKANPFRGERRESTRDR